MQTVFCLCFSQWHHKRHRLLIMENGQILTAFNIGSDVFQLQRVQRNMFDPEFESNQVTHSFHRHWNYCGWTGRRKQIWWHWLSTVLHLIQIFIYSSLNLLFFFSIFANHMNTKDLQSGNASIPACSSSETAIKCFFMQVFLKSMQCSRKRIRF